MSALLFALPFLPAKSGMGPGKMSCRRSEALEIPTLCRFSHSP
jgi:hypothetical protein